MQLLVVLHFLSGKVMEFVHLVHAIRLHFLGEFPGLAFGFFEPKCHNLIHCSTNTFKSLGKMPYMCAIYLSYIIGKMNIYFQGTIMWWWGSVPHTIPVLPCSRTEDTELYLAICRRQRIYKQRIQQIIQIPDPSPTKHRFNSDSYLWNFSLFICVFSKLFSFLRWQTFSVHFKFSYKKVLSDYVVQLIGKFSHFKKQRTIKGWRKIFIDSTKRANLQLS